MQKKSTPLFQLTFFWLVLLSGLLLGSCTDECQSTITYTVYEPVYMTKAELRNSVKVEASRELQKPGKIYSYGHYLFVNEQQEGIHIIDNSNPAAPQPLSFIAIPGNVDLAVKGDFLYADNYIDLVVMDISNPLALKLLNRVENIFTINNTFISAQTETFVAKYNEKVVTEPYPGDCDGNNPGVVFFDNAGSGGFQLNSSKAPLSTAPGGNGGSMARFTITGDHLYAVNHSSLQLFDISDQAHPQRGNTIQLGWGIETIFPYQDKLFIGSTTGMHIYDNSNPSNPVRLSTYAHVNSCDPVVVDGDLAWVTLRSGNACNGFSNQLDVINIKDARNPQLVKTFPMQNPHGLGIDQSLLFLCEGTYGLKVFDIKNPLQVTDNLRKHFQNLHAYDVIPLGKTLLMVGEDGLYQYDYSNPTDIKLVSRIPVKPTNS
jgi:hypothetical protein